MKKILIIGATSAIAQSFARIWAIQGASFFLVGRNTSKLDEVSSDLIARGASSATLYELDATNVERHVDMLQHCISTLGQIDIALIAHGTLPNQSDCEIDVTTALQEFNNNSTSVIALLTSIANHFETQKVGSIAVISSVAGDRGRPSNYLYGAAKAAVSVFAEGLSARLYKKGVHLMVVKPGFVDTPMTQHLSLPKALLSTPEQIASLINNGFENKKTVIYTPKFWALIMLVIKSIPNTIFKRLNL